MGSKSTVDLKLTKNVMAIKAFVESNKLNGNIFAKSIGLGNSIYYRWMRGDRFPDLATLYKICDIYNLKFEDHFERPQANAEEMRSETKVKEKVIVPPQEYDFIPTSDELEFLKEFRKLSGINKYALKIYISNLNSLTEGNLKNNEYESDFLNEALKPDKYLSIMEQIEDELKIHKSQSKSG